MEAYDDRPISVYDNLNMPTATTATESTTATTAEAAAAATKSVVQTSTPKARLETAIITPVTSPVATKPASLINETTTARSPYADISFKFNETRKPQQLQFQQQQQPQQQHQREQQSQLLPNGNRSLNQSEQQQQQQLHQQVHPSYTTPFKSTTTSATAAAAALKTSPLPLLTTSLTAATTNNTMNASPAVQRPLSQHSQSELNEASQSIAAVKAALNDAKSKFFGLNGYSSPTALQQQQQQQTPAPQQLYSNNSLASNVIDFDDNESQTFALLPQSVAAAATTHIPKVQIIASTPTPPPPPPPKPQPKYQNIPENSAIFRQQPPELPPKPSSESLKNTSGNYPTTPIIVTAIPIHHNRIPSELTMPQHMQTTTTTTPLSKLSSPASTSISSSSAAAPPNSSLDPTASHQAAKILPFTTYQQIPLSDLDIAQPSQAVYMSTTVPQNIKGSKIAGRHTPTRNSLRHSRMLVVSNKNYQGVQHPNPLDFKYPNLARWLLILDIIIGLLITFLAIWIFILAPSTAIQDNPYWSGLTLLLAGIIGLVLVRYKRIKRHKVRENCFIFLRADSYLLSLLAVSLCAIAIICASIHFARLSASDTKCVSSNILLAHGSCTCTFHANNIETAAAAPQRNSTNSNGLLDEEAFEDFTDRSYKREYRDLSCAEVRAEWICMLILSIVLNSIGFIIALIYMALLVCCRANDSNRFYTSVHTSTF